MVRGGHDGTKLERTALRALGYKEISTFHLNQGHAALLSLELLYEAAKRSGRESVIQADAEAVRYQCVFTTHTFLKNKKETDGVNHIELDRWIDLFTGDKHAAAYEYWYEMHKGIHEMLREYPV